MVLVYLRRHQIPPALSWRAYSSVWRQEGALCVALSGFLPLLLRLLPVSTFHCLSVCMSSQGCGGPWLSFQILPAISAVSILELPANSGSSRMSQTPRLHIAMQFLTLKIKKKWSNLSSAQEIPVGCIHILIKQPQSLLITSLPR